MGIRHPGIFFISSRFCKYISCRLYIILLFYTWEAWFINTSYVTKTTYSSFVGGSFMFGITHEANGKLAAAGSNRGFICLESQSTLNWWNHWKQLSYLSFDLPHAFRVRVRNWEWRLTLDETRTSTKLLILFLKAW